MIALRLVSESLGEGVYTPETWTLGGYVRILPTTYDNSHSLYVLATYVIEFSRSHIKNGKETRPN